jgi:hypothetical protein
MRPFVPLALAALLTTGCDPAAGRGMDRAPTAARPTTPLSTPLSDSAFGALVERLSEPDRYFDTDNLISNEASYLHAVGELEARGVRGGAYLGVGPDQNFSYMAAVRPELAFVVDIRRDNLLQHLWFKALFERSETRLDFLCLLVARSCGGPSDGLTVGALVGRVDRAEPVDTLELLIGAVVTHAASSGVPLTDRDREAIGSIHRRFAAEGLDLQFNSHGRAPNPGYPTLRRLVLERDLEGRQVGYLADEADYRYLAGFQEENRVVPVVGNLAGDRALAGIARELRQRGLTVSVFYVSNVEFYLFRDRIFPDYMANLSALPSGDGSVLVRSFFNRSRIVPETVPGYISTQLVQPIPALVADWEEGRVRSYYDLVTGVND